MSKFVSLARTVRDVVASTPGPLSLAELAGLLEVTPREVKFLLVVAGLLREVTLAGDGTVHPVTPPGPVGTPEDPPASPAGEATRSRGVQTSEPPEPPETSGRPETPETGEPGEKSTLATVPAPPLPPHPRCSAASDPKELCLRPGDFAVLGHFYQVVQCRPPHKRGEALVVPAARADRSPAQHRLVRAALRLPALVEVRQAGATFRLVFTERGHAVARQIVAYQRLHETPTRFPVPPLGFSVRVVDTAT